MTAALVDAHAHLARGLCAAGLVPTDAVERGFLTAHRELWWRFDRALDEAALRASVRLAVADALLAGTTGAVDHHESPSCIEGSLDVVADACQELGLRAVLCYAVTERNGGRDEARRGLEESARFLASNDRRLVRGVLGVHASYTVSDETLREIGDVARDLDTVVHVAAAADSADVADARVRGFDGPLQRLLELGALPEGSVVAHAVGLGEREVRLANEHGLWLVQCPRSNARGRSGYPAALHLARRAALGTDGIGGDLVAEAAQLAADAPGREPDPEGCTARLDGGAAILAERFGGAARTPAAELAIGSLRVDGCEVVAAGRLVAADGDAIRAEAEVQAGRVLARMERG